MKFDFNDNYVLEDEVALLRPLKKTDYDLLLPFALTEPEIWKYSLVPASSEQGMMQYINFALDSRINRREYAFIVFDKRTNEWAGSTRFYDIQIANKSMQLGYTWYGKQFQGSGLNKHCKYLLLSFAFDTLGMERVELRADNENERSKAAMISIGCKPEGVLRSSSYRQDGSRRDSIVLSILKSEWENGGREMLKNKLL